MRLAILLIICFLVAESQQGVDHCKTKGKLANGNEVCIECDKGHFLNTSRSLIECPECKNDCEVCNYNATTNLLTCLQCEKGNRLDPADPSKCLECPEDCDECDSQGKCTKCEDESEMTSDGSCKKKQKFWLWFFVIAGIIVFLLGGLFVYRKYFANRGDAEAEAYKQAGNYKAAESLSPIKQEENPRRQARNPEDSD